MKKQISFIITALCILATLGGCSDSSGGYNAGTYTATAQGYGGDMTVEVEFSKDSILSVQVTEHQETEWFAEKAIPLVPDAIIEKQTYEVDGFTSATFTSDAIKAAVKDCMEQAGKK